MVKDIFLRFQDLQDRILGNDFSFIDEIEDTIPSTKTLYIDSQLPTDGHDFSLPEAFIYLTLFGKTPESGYTFAVKSNKGYIRFKWYSGHEVFITVSLIDKLNDGETEIDCESLKNNLMFFELAKASVSACCARLLDVGVPVTIIQNVIQNLNT